jgi:L-arabinokinase
VTGSPLPDTHAFRDRIVGRDTPAAPQVRDLFAAGPVSVARAPGRLDVMGGIADYSGSLVLQWPIAEATHAAVQLDAAPRVRIVSMLERGEVRTCDVPLDALVRDGRPVTYAAARAYFAEDPARHWAAYVAGAWLVLAREAGWIPRGARVLVESNVPEGKGISSSAALEASVMTALTAAAGLSLSPGDLATHCQRVENLVVGAPCGIMDQMASVLGEAGRLMALLCQPAVFQGALPLPEGLAVWGIDSGIRHAVSGADYGSVRIGAFMGYRVLAALAGLPVEPDESPGHVRVSDSRWHGYLANVGLPTFDSYAADIPETMTGAEFLAQYGGTTDRVTRVDPQCRYAVRIPARHPVAEHARVTAWRDALIASEHGNPAIDQLGSRLGSLMYESHASYSACGLGSAGTDRLVALARAAGPAQGVYGAKITGGGSGGTVALLTRCDAGPVVDAIASEYARKSGHEGRVFRGSSPGAAASGTISLELP